MTSPVFNPVVDPIIVFGAGRSGTTLLTDVLNAHSSVVGVHEPRLIWRFGNDRRSDQLRPDHATAEVVKHIHTSFNRILDDADASRLVENTPGNALRPHFVDKVFPDARYVHIVRNGWAAVPSKRDFWENRGAGFDRRQLQKLGRRVREARPSQYRHYVVELYRRFPRSQRRHVALYGPRPAGIQAVADELGRLEAAAYQWQACVESVAAFGRALPSERYLELRLESLDKEVMNALVAFCGLTPQRAVLARFQEQYRPELASRRPPLSGDERTRIAPYVLAANAMLGYEAEEPT